MIRAIGIERIFIFSECMVDSFFLTEHVDYFFNFFFGDRVQQKFKFVFEIVSLSSFRFRYFFLSISLATEPKNSLNSDAMDLLSLTTLLLRPFSCLLWSFCHLVVCYCFMPCHVLQILCLYVSPCLLL